MDPDRKDHSYSASSSSKPKAKSKAKCHLNCCVPHCTKHGYYEAEGHGKVSYFRFPGDPKLRKQWLIKIRRDEDKFFEIKPHTSVCSLHFLPSDYEYFPFSGRRHLHDGKIPTVFNCWDNVGRGDLVKKGKPRKENRLQSQRILAAASAVKPVNPESVDNDVDNEQSDGLGCVDDGLTEPDDIPCDLHRVEIDNEVEKLSAKELECKILNEKIRSLTSELDSMKVEIKNCEFSIDNVRPSDIAFFTGFPSIEVCEAVLNFLNPGENGENIIMANMDSQSSSSSTPILSSSKRGRPRKLSPRNQFFLYLCRVRLGLLELDLAYRFRISLSSVSNIIITWANFVYLRLGSLNIWPTKEQVVKSMPETFLKKYPDTRVIIDACEMKLEMPSSLVLKSQSYSNYKSANTLKGLIGITPAGNLSFVSQLYTGSISDKELTIRSGILKLPFERKDSLMADKGFDIQELLDPIGVVLNIPPFLGKHQQMPAEDVASTQSIAAERIHVERLINKVKNFHIFDQVIPLSLSGSINQIWSGCALLTLFQNPIISRTDPQDNQDNTDPEKQ